MEEIDQSQGEHDFSQFVGRAVDEVVEQIRANNPGLSVVKIPEGSMVTCDYRTDRVRVYYDEAGVVNDAPRIG